MWKVNQFKYSCRPSSEVQIGQVKLGGCHAVKVQSMANTDTNDIEGSVEQCLKIVAAGADIVRFTTQGTREAESLKQIHDKLRDLGNTTPLVADIHFNPNAADAAAQYVEKVRINPGNYVKSIKGHDTSDYTEEEFQTEYQRIRDRFIPFLDICKKHNTAIRIGVNHGSLSERMMNRYGDTPRGMVESCMEFLQICREQNFHNVVISMKTSNTVMMVHVVRLLVDEMEAADLHYPLHLGVTEAGDGEDGRVKSAVGIGSLLADGIGDTIRVSLSEDPDLEVPVGRALVAYTGLRRNAEAIDALESKKLNRYEYNRRETLTVGNIGGENVPVAVVNKDGGFATMPDYLFLGNQLKASDGTVYDIYDNAEFLAKESFESDKVFVHLSYTDLSEAVISKLKATPNAVVLLSSSADNAISEQRAFYHAMLEADCKTPVILQRSYTETIMEQLQIKAAIDMGALLIDGFGDGVYISNDAKEISIEQVNSLAFALLQATRTRISKTEYVSCPSCGRTMFNLQTVIARIKARTDHLKGLKIGIMGCIVNGPGEMADADYGYVGAGRGKVSLYKKKECVERNIPEDEAVDRLIELIKVHGDWHE
jgi:(E)-4-hydroxy-3-methylbut-2-enyl-diphosphate synthase